MNSGSGRLDLPGAPSQPETPEDCVMVQSSGRRISGHSQKKSGVSGSERRQNAAMAAACRILSVRARTEKELRDALAKKGFNSTHIDNVVAEMIQHGYIDDVDAARRWAAYSVEERRYGARGIALRLVRRGIDPDLADEAARLAYQASGIDEFDVALELAQSRFKAEDCADDDASRRAVRRIAGFLARRGFMSDTIARVLRELFKDAC